MVLSQIGLIFIAGGASAVIFAMVVLLVISFGHPDDKNVALFPKFVVIISLFLACTIVLFLPFDVACARSMAYDIFIRTDVLWQILLALTFFLVVFGIPFAFFFYEFDASPDATASVLSKQSSAAFGYALLSFVIMSGIIGILYPFMAIVIIEAHGISKPLDASLTSFVETNAPDDITPVTLQLPMSFLVFSFSILSFIGWTVMLFFAPIGLATIPLDLINEFRSRPIPISTQEYARRKLMIGKRSTELLEEARELQSTTTDLDRRVDRKSKKRDRKSFNKLEIATFDLKSAANHLHESYRLRGGNPLWHFGKLVLGLLCGLFSLFWVLQMIGMAIPASGLAFFLDSALSFIEDNVLALFGTLFFALHSLYLLVATMKGIFKAGLRFPLLFRIYPMEPSNTMTNSFLVNSWIILLCSVPMAQFCAMVFPVFGRFTSSSAIFGSQFQHMKYLSIMWKDSAYLFFMLSVFLISFIFSLIFPRNVAKNLHKRLKRIREAGVQ